MTSIAIAVFTHCTAALQVKETFKGDFVDKSDSATFLVIGGLVALMALSAGGQFFYKDYCMRKQAEYNAIELKKQGTIQSVPATTP